MRARFPSLSFTFLCSACALALTATAFAGEQWEYTSKMKSPEMEAMGMVMPPMVVKICKEDGWKTPPKNDEKCKISNFKNNGKTMSWDVACPEGKGHGEITLQGNDKFTGFTEFSTANGQMRMDMSGRKLGTCDAAGQQVSVDGKPLPHAIDLEKLKKQMEQPR